MIILHGFITDHKKNIIILADRSTSYLDLHLEIDSEGRLRTKLYDKRDDLNFPIVNFPFQQHLHMEYISIR
jgi:hypothetical protein